MLKDTDTKTNASTTENDVKNDVELSTGFIFFTLSAIAAVPLGIGTLIIRHDPTSFATIWIGAPMFVIGVCIGLLAIASLFFANKHNSPEGIFIELDQQIEKGLARRNGYINPSEVSKDAHLFFADVELGNRDMIVNIFDGDDGDDGDDAF